MSNGTQSAISFAKETTWGTAVVPTKTIAVHSGDGLQIDRAIQYRQAIKGSLHKNNMPSFKGASVYSGEYEIDLTPDYPVQLFASAMGGISSALKGGETTVYNHTLTESATKPSLTVEQAVAEICYRYAGFIASGFKLNVKSGESVTATFPGMAKTAASATAITPALETGRPFDFVDVGATGLSIGGTAIDELMTLELEYKNGITFLHSLSGSVDPNFSYVKPAELTGKIDLFLNSTSAAELTNYLNKTSRSLQLTLTGGTIGSTSNTKLDLTIPVCTFKVAKWPLTFDYNHLEIEFEAEENSSGALISNFVCTNSTVSY